MHRVRVPVCMRKRKRVHLKEWWMQRMRRKYGSLFALFLIAALLVPAIGDSISECWVSREEEKKREREEKKWNRSGCHRNLLLTYAKNQKPSFPVTSRPRTWNPFTFVNPSFFSFYLLPAFININTVNMYINIYIYKYELPSLFLFICCCCWRWL